MKSIKTLLTASTVLALAGTQANAALISILDLAPDATSKNGFTITSATSGTTVTLSFTQTGDLDGGTLDDTLAFDLVYTAYTGSTYSGGDVTLGTASTPNMNNVNWHNNTFAGGDTLALEVTNVNYTDGEGGDHQAIFNGFLDIRPTHYSSAIVGDVDYYLSLVGATTITGDPTFGADLSANGDNASLYFTASDGPVRLRNLDLQFETVAVPEPSSVALLGLGFGALALRRRRS
ncbi:PEP-CTERM sorting domain-containing protein [Rubritalea spongiae]|uniref:PEP-CTERM sorting domain-containing protein n=1 Tax=Rubritalea spongiae TaxID=430797 RepID=A0ABW5E4P4_9BACT